MNHEQIALVQTSFEHVLPIADAAAALFYERLFALDPTLQPLFTGDMHEQGRKLMTMIRFVVKGLHQLELLIPSVQDLGRCHAAYGVLDNHYDTVGVALLATLDQGLGERFTPEVRAAWVSAYILLAGTMRGRMIDTIAY